MQILSKKSSRFCLIITFYRQNLVLPQGMAYTNFFHFIVVIMKLSYLRNSLPLIILLMQVACSEITLSTDAQIITNKNMPSIPVTPNVSGSELNNPSYSFSIQSQAKNGKAEVINNQLVFTPDSHFSGSDSFNYLVSDGSSQGLGIASITVNDISSAPLSSHARMTSRSGIESSGVTPFVNEADFLESHTFSIVSNPTSGTATIKNNQLYYTPNILSGTDNFEYQIMDSQGFAVNGTALVRIYENTTIGNNNGLNRCLTASSVNVDGTLALRTNAGRCAVYGELISRKTSNGDDVVLQYVVHRPSDGTVTKAAIILIAGGTLRLNPNGFDATTGNINSTGGNFLVRSAQLFAEGGYLVIVMNRPSDVADVSHEVDQYRISVNHAVDILELNRQINTDNLPLMITGTSRGALSAVAANPIATAIHISSPVTSGSLPSLWLGEPGTPKLQAAYVQRPARVSWHSGDQCGVTTPANAENFYNQLGPSASSSFYNGGVEVTTASGNVMVNNCGAFDFHGFLGIEPEVISSELSFFDAQIEVGTPPIAASGIIYAQSQKRIDLSRFTQGTNLNFSLPYAETSLGGTVSLDGDIVTYVPNDDSIEAKDYFVYVVSNNAGVRAASIEIELIN